MLVQQTTTPVKGWEWSKASSPWSEDAGGESMTLVALNWNRYPCKGMGRVGWICSIKEGVVVYWTGSFKSRLAKLNRPLNRVFVWSNALSQHQRAARRHNFGGALCTFYSPTT